MSEILVAGLDIETTGLLSAEQRIIEIYIGVYKLSTGQKIDELNQRIDPCRIITAEAQRVHHIHSSDLVGKPIFSIVAPKIEKILKDVKFIVSHNGDEFDILFINQELKSAGFSEITKPNFDTMKKGRNATPNGKVPNLGELCFAYNVDYDSSKSHAASYDVDVMMDCFFKGVNQKYFNIEEFVK